jgi:hypothetical protein
MRLFVTHIGPLACAVAGGTGMHQTAEVSLFRPQGREDDSPAYTPLDAAIAREGESPRAACTPVRHAPRGTRKPQLGPAIFRGASGRFIPVRALHGAICPSPGPFPEGESRE